MALWRIDNDNLRAIANEIREANGSNNQYTVDQMPDAIKSLSIGPGDSSLQWDDPSTCYVKISQKMIDDGYGIRFGIRIYDEDTAGGYRIVNIKFGDETPNYNYTGIGYPTRSKRFMWYITHKYSNPGEYTIQLKCLDSNSNEVSGGVYEFYEYYSFYKVE